MLEYFERIGLKKLIVLQYLAEILLRHEFNQKPIQKCFLVYISSRQFLISYKFPKY